MSNDRLYIKIRSYRTVLLLFVGTICALLLNLNFWTESMGATWYVRSQKEKTLRNDGKSYFTAFSGFKGIVWGKGGVVAGDTLYVCGIHSSNCLDIKTSGEKNLRIVIAGDYGGDPGVINCRNGKVSFAKGISTNGNGYIWINKIEIRNNDDLKSGGIEIDKGSHDVTVSECILNPDRGRGIRIWGGCHNCVVSKTVFNGEKKSGNLLHFYVDKDATLRDVQIVDNVFVDSGHRSISAYWMSGAWLQDIQIKSNRIEGGNGGIRFVPGANAEMAYKIDINGNKITDTKEASIRLEWVSSDRGISYVRNNTISRTGGSSGAPNVNGIRVGACNGIVVEKNNICGVNSSAGDGNGIIVDIALINGQQFPSKFTVVRYNTTYKNLTQGGAGISVYGSLDSEIYYNICFDNQKGISVGEEDFSIPRSERTWIFNNVMYKNRIAGGVLRARAGISTWQNNIVYRNARYGFRTYPGAEHPKSEHNCVGENKENFIGWKDVSGVHKPPLLLDPEKGDFRLKAESPCIDAGIKISGKNDLRDMHGETIPQLQATDIGAYEYKE